MTLVSNANFTLILKSQFPRVTACFTIIFSEGSDFRDHRFICNSGLDLIKFPDTLPSR